MGVTQEMTTHLINFLFHILDYSNADIQILSKDILNLKRSKTTLVLIMSVINMM